jgi:hypothetical protein
MYENKNTIIYNPDVIEVIDTIKILNEKEEVEVIDEDDDEQVDKYSFRNQRLQTLAKEYLDNEFGGVPSSTMNTTGNYLFHSEFIKNHAFNGWFENCKPDNFDNIKAYDYNKHYTSCFIGMDLKFGWPVYNIFDEVKNF